MPAEIVECVDCGQTFLLGASEQRFYRERGLELPKRCKDCRSKRRYERQSGMRGIAGPPPGWQYPRSPVVDEKAKVSSPKEKQGWLSGIRAALAGAVTLIVKKVTGRKDD